MALPDWLEFALSKSYTNKAIMGTVGPLVGASAYEIAVNNGFVGSEPQWLASLVGADGRNPEFSFSATNLIWRLVGDTVWQNLVPLDDIRGEDGTPVELRVYNEELQWRYVGSATWTYLIDLSAIETNASIFPHVSGQDYEVDQVFYDEDTGFIYVVLQNHTSTTIEDDLESGFIRQIGGGSGSNIAADITYDNTKSGLDADNAQDALDELNELLENIEERVDDIENTREYTLIAGSGIIIDRSTPEAPVITATGVDLPRYFTSTQTIAGGVGTEVSDLDLNEVTPIETGTELAVADIVIFSNGSQAKVSEIDETAETFDVVIISVQLSASWGTITGSIETQSDLMEKFNELDAADISFESQLPAPTEPTDPSPITSTNIEGAIDELAERINVVSQAKETDNILVTDETKESILESATSQAEINEQNAEHILEAEKQIAQIEEDLNGVVTKTTSIELPQKYVMYEVPLDTIGGISPDFVFKVAKTWINDRYGTMGIYISTNHEDDLADPLVPVSVNVQIKTWAGNVSEDVVTDVLVNGESVLDSGNVANIENVVLSGNENVSYLNYTENPDDDIAEGELRWVYDDSDDNPTNPNMALVSNPTGMILKTAPNGQAIETNLDPSDVVIASQLENSLTPINNRITSLEQYGVFAGSFLTFASVPLNQSGFPSPLTVNDFIEITADETQGGQTTRYILTAIGSGGELTWEFNRVLSTDVTGKMDKIVSPNQNRVLVSDSLGQAVESSLVISDIAAQSQIDDLNTEILNTNTALNETDTNLSELNDTTTSIGNTLDGTRFIRVTGGELSSTINSTVAVPISALSWSDNLVQGKSVIVDDVGTLGIFVGYQDSPTNSVALITTKTTSGMSLVTLNSSYLLNPTILGYRTFTQDASPEPIANLAVNRLVSDSAGNIGAVVSADAVSGAFSVMTKSASADLTDIQTDITDLQNQTTNIAGRVEELESLITEGMKHGNIGDFSQTSPNITVVFPAEPLYTKPG